MVLAALEQLNTTTNTTMRRKTPTRRTKRKIGGDQSPNRDHDVDDSHEGVVLAVVDVNDTEKNLDPVATPQPVTSRTSPGRRGDGVATIGNERSPATMSKRSRTNESPDGVSVVKRRLLGFQDELRAALAAKEEEISALRDRNCMLLKERNELDESLQQKDIAMHELNDLLQKKDHEIMLKESEISSISQRNTKLFELAEIGDRNVTKLQENKEIMEGRLFKHLSEARANVVRLQDEVASLKTKLNEHTLSDVTASSVETYKKDVEERINEISTTQKMQLVTIANQREEINMLESELAAARKRFGSGSSGGVGNQDTINMLERQLTEQVKQRKALESTLQKLTRDNVALISNKVNSSHLTERIRSLEHELDIFKKRAATALQLELEFSKLKTRVIEYDALTECGNSTEQNGDVKAEVNDANIVEEKLYSTASLVKELADTKFKVKLLEEKLVANDAESSIKSYAEKLETMLRDTREEMSRLEEANVKLNFENECFKGKISCLEREVNNFKDQLSSYIDEEESLMENVTHDESNKNELYSKEKTLRIKKLETLASENRVTINTLLDDIKVLKTEGHTGSIKVVKEEDNTDQSDSRLVKLDIACMSPELHEFIDTMKTDIATSKEEIARWKRTCTLLDEEISRLYKSISDAIAMTDYNVNTTKVLQLRDNPTYLVDQEVKRGVEMLKNENERLLSSLLELSDLIGDPSIVEKSRDKKQSKHHNSENVDRHVVPAETYNVVQDRVFTLERELVEREKRILRLREVFTEKVKDYREAIQRLLGYDVVLEMDGTIQLESMFASEDRGNPGFEYKSDGSNEGQLRMIRTASSSYEGEIEQAADLFLKKHMNIPAFLSTVTLKLSGF